MIARLWGTRGSIACAGPQTVAYGGDTACVEVRTSDGGLIALDAGSGIRALGAATRIEGRVDVLLTHLHMDHVQGLPFLGPFLDPRYEIHVWGPGSTTQSLKDRLARYLSPPLFPVRVRDLPHVEFHDVSPGSFMLGSVKVTTDLICHPGSTVGYRLEESSRVITYMPDHEPALGRSSISKRGDWVSGYALARGADVLIHDSQYTDEEYEAKPGWGHTSHSQLLDFAALCEVGSVVTFHHDPSHDDGMLDDVHDELIRRADGFQLIPGTAGLTVT